MSNRLAATFLTLCALLFLTFTAQLTFAQRHRVHKRTASPVTERWYTFTGPDGDFRLDFPRAPKRDPDGQGVMTIIRSYGVTTEDGTRFDVGFQDVGGDPRSRENNELAPDFEEKVTAASRADGARAVQMHRLAKNVIEIEYRLTIEEAKAEDNYLQRTIVRRGRVYALSCGTVGGGGDLNRSICGRFFNSMQFTK